MRAEVITIGTELLLGDIDDTNATYIARQLRQIGLDLLYRTTVGDNEGRIAEVIDNALNRADVVITTGGLGPTVDDVTRESIARATGRSLEFQQALLDQIAERFRSFNVQMSENNRRQAYLPDGAALIENPVGTAPGFILETERGVIITVPGVPREMHYMMEHAVLPYLRQHMDAPAVIKSVVLRTAGIGESQVDARIADLMTNPNPTVGLAAHTGQTDVRVTAKARTEADADAMLEDMAAQVKARLGAWIYGSGTERLEDVVKELLRGQHAGVATVEVDTGGLLAERLCGTGAEDAPLASCAGAFPTLAELDLPGIDLTLPLGELARQAAEVVRERAGAAYGVAVFMRTGERGIAGELGTEIGLASEDGSRTRTFNWLNDRPDANVWAVTHALAMLHRFLLKYPEAANT